MKGIWNPEKVSRCLYCLHLNKDKLLTCKAFPKRIPIEILASQFNHINEHPKDKGIRFKLDKKAVERWGL